MLRAVQDIAAAGCTGTGIFDGDLLPYAEEPAELLDLLNEHGIELVSVYTGELHLRRRPAEELDRMRRAAELAATFSAGRLVFGGDAQRAAGVRDDDHRRLADALDRVQAIAADHGLDATYHPHLAPSCKRRRRSNGSSPRRPSGSARTPHTWQQEAGIRPPWSAA